MWCRRICSWQGGGLGQMDKYCVFSAAFGPWLGWAGGITPSWLGVLFSELAPPQEL